MLQGTKQYKKITGDKIIDNINYSKELYDFLKKIHWTKNSSPFRSEVINSSETVKGLLGNSSGYSHGLRNPSADVHSERSIRSKRTQKLN